jgi:hypothetical protein
MHPWVPPRILPRLRTQARFKKDPRPSFAPIIGTHRISTHKSMKPNPTNAKTCNALVAPKHTWNSTAEPACFDPPGSTSTLVSFQSMLEGYQQNCMSRHQSMPQRCRLGSSLGCAPKQGSKNPARALPPSSEFTE